VQYQRGAPEGAKHGEAIKRRRGSTPARNYVDTGADLGEIKAWGGCSPRVRTQERLGDGGDTVKPRVDSGGLRPHGEDFGEHRLGKPEGLGANREVS
jgi:hypothetical protein